MVLFAVPASAVHDVAAAYGDVARGDQFVIHAVRGVCPNGDFALPHQVIRSQTCVRKIGVLGGPLYAPDLAEGRALAAVLASRFDETFAAVSALTQQTQMRLHPTHDVIGVEVAGAISNVSALAVGMAEALSLGETARGVLLTRGLAEAARLGVALGAQSATFTGLAGLGDLIPRQVASTERHHQIGALLVQGKSLESALTEVEGEVEGVCTAAQASAEAARRGVDVVLVNVVNEVCQGRREAKEALDEVLERHLDLGRGLSA